MKERKNKATLVPHILLFILCSVFIVGGLLGRCFVDIKDQVLLFGSRIIKGDWESFPYMIGQVDKISTEKLAYHDELMELYALYQNVNGTRVVEKDDTVVVKTTSGSLADYTPKEILDSEIAEITSKIKTLQQKAESANAEFLYVYAPKKNHYVKYPSNITCYELPNYEKFKKSLQEESIPYIDLSQGLEGIAENMEDLYFKTDHHWTPQTGFAVNRLICEELHDRYGFEYNEEYTAIENYEVKTYEDYFLGSYGKKTGSGFTESGPDDIDLITPKFYTQLIEEQPIKEQVRAGSFEESVLYMENIERKSYYDLNPYATYSGGDFRLQIFKNRLQKDGKKVVILRDSFACTVCPFMALQFQEIHMLDMRNYDYYVGEKLNAYDYIQEIKPDYVIVLYSGVGAGSGRFDFD